MAWYYRDGDQELGPVDKKELQQLIKAQKIGGQTLVRSENSDTWQPLVELVRGKKTGKAAAPPDEAAPAMETAAPPSQPPETPKITAPPSSPPPVDHDSPQAAPDAPPIKYNI